MNDVHKSIFILVPICFYSCIASASFCPPALVLSTTLFSPWLDVLATEPQTAGGSNETAAVDEAAAATSRINARTTGGGVNRKGESSKVKREFSASVQKWLASLKERFKDLRNRLKTELGNSNNKSQEKLAIIYLLADGIAAELEQQNKTTQKQIQQRTRQLKQAVKKFKKKVMEAIVAPFYRTLDAFSDKMSNVTDKEQKVQAIRTQVKYLKSELKEVLSLSGLYRILLRINLINNKYAEINGLELGKGSSLESQVKAFASKTFEWIFAGKQ